jgi:hypothetical protein
MASNKKTNKAASHSSGGAKKGIRTLNTYNKILGVFGDINRQQGDDTRLSASQMRKIVSDSLYPAYKGKSQRNVKVRDVQRKIRGIMEMIPAREICDINLIPSSFYAALDWFTIDEYLERIMPDCIYVRVNAGEHGMTSIFNTRNYSYHKTSVKQIIENLRELAGDTSQLDFQGVKKLKKGKPNDGNPENYYIDFVLNINAVPVDDTVSVRFDVPTRANPKAKRVRDLINDRMGQLKTEKTKKTRARKRTEKNVRELSELSKLERKSKSPAKKAAAMQMKMNLLNKSRALIDKDFEAGLITKKDYDALVKKLYRNLGGGGTV